MADYTIFGTNTSWWQGNIANGSWEIDSTEFYVTSPCWLTAIRFYRPSTGLYGTIKTAVFQVSTATTGVEVSGTRGSATYTNGSGSTGWLARTLTTPVALTVNQRYRVFIKWGTNRTASTSTSFWSAGGPGANGLTNGPLVAPTNASATGGYTSRGDNTNSSTADVYYAAGVGLTYAYPIDVTVTDVDPTGQSQTMFLPHMVT